MRDAQASAGRDAPFGQHLTVPSSLTGRPLTYFVPYPITQLSSRLSAPRLGRTRSSRGAAWLLTPFMCTRNGSAFGEIESPLIRAYAKLMAGQLVLRSSADLIELAAGLDSQISGLRDQISYAGGRTPSTAQAIYAPASDVPPLIDSLANFLGGELDQWDAFEVAALVSEYAIRVHPFVDGNGRWARLLTAYAGARSGDEWIGAAIAVFRKTGWDVARPILESSTHQGLVPYYEAAHRFATDLYDIVEVQGLNVHVERLVEALESVITSPAHRHRLLAEFIARGSLLENTVQRGLACSRKKAAGLVDAVAALAIPWIHRSGPSLSCVALHNEMDGWAQKILNQIKYS